MSVWNKILPHRLLVNRSLRKASDELRTHIDEYQLEYDKKIEHCTAEIEQAKAKKNSDFEKVQISFANELSKDQSLYRAVEVALCEYTDVYFLRQYFCAVRNIKAIEMQSLTEYGNFLTEQMSLIGQEINILDERKDKLSYQSQVDDIIDLIRLSDCCNIIVDTQNDVQSLLAKVNEMLPNLEDGENIKKQALLKLRNILQERVELFSTIQYISWIIQQKKQLSRHLSIERRNVNESKNTKKIELNEVNENIRTFTHTLDEQAKTVRDFWNIPITEFNIQISFLYKKLNKCFSEIKDLGHRIEQMKNEGSDDSNTWDRLWREKNEWKSEIPEIKTDIETLKAERQHWYSRRNLLFSLCKQNQVDLISDKNADEYDELRIINSRLAKFYSIEEEFNRSEKKRFAKESADIQQKKNEIISKLSAQISNAKKGQTEKQATLNKVTLWLSNAKNNDNRAFIARLFSESTEVKKAKLALQDAKLQKKNANDLLSSLENQRTLKTKEFDKQLKSCQPKPYNPTMVDAEEIDKLEWRKTELLNKQEWHTTT